MASLSTDPKGNRRILFQLPRKRRQTVYLGKVPMEWAREFNRQLERLVVAKITGEVLKTETATWLADLPDIFHEKLCAVGLTSQRQKTLEAAAIVPTLDAFLDQYIQGRPKLKPRTKINLEAARKELAKHFGKTAPMEKITPGHADEFREALEGRLGDNTVRRICGRAKQFFRAAERKNLIAESPFGDMKHTKVRANDSRLFYVTREMACRVLDACPDDEWRLIFALCRFGGLRCPSELLGFRIDDVNWEHDTFLVRSPKTERYPNGQSRLTPIFPELRPYLLASSEQALPGSEFLIRRYRSQNSNLRTQLERIIARAGLTAWPKLFQNLRSTRETELIDEGHNIKAVCKWLGNSPAVALEHYMQVTQ